MTNHQARQLFIKLSIYFCAIQLTIIPINIMGVVSIEATRVITFTLVAIFFYVINKDYVFSYKIFSIIITLFLFLFWYYIRIEGSGITYALLDGFKLLFVLYFLLLCFSSCKKIGHDKYLKLVLKSLTVSFYIFIIATFIYTFLAFLNGVVSPKSGSYVVTGPTGRALTSLTACLFSIIWINFYFINKNRKYLLYFFCSLLIVLGTLVRIALGGEIIALVVLFLSRGKLILIVISGGIGSLFIIYFGERFISEMFVVASIDELDFSNISELIQNIRLTGRLEVWRISLTNFFQNPILGGGTGSSNQLLHDSGIGLEQSHNDYIKVLSDLGGIGFVLYLLWYFVPLTILCNTIRRNSENGYAIMAVSCLLALMVFSLTDNVISYSPYLFPLAFILFPLALIPDRKFHIYNKNDNQERL